MKGKLFYDKKIRFFIFPYFKHSKYMRNQKNNVIKLVNTMFFYFKSFNTPLMYLRWIDFNYYLKIKNAYRFKEIKILSHVCEEAKDEITIDSVVDQFANI